MATSPDRRGQGAGSDLDAIRSLCEHVERELHDIGHPALGRRVRAAVTRLARPTPVVCVVGEFKQGKSSLVNQLIGRPVCPVDDDLATSAITVLRYGPEVVVTVHRRTGEEMVNERVPPGEVWDWVSERGNPDNRRNVERLDVELPEVFLERGPALVDTPGVGGLWAGHAIATLAFLPFADAVLFASDASAEMSAPELAFLRRAAELCPNVVVCLTKIDLYPEWRRIAELNRHHVERIGLDLPLLPVSSTLRHQAILRADPDLDDESGFPALLRVIDQEIVGPARIIAARRALDEVRSALTQVDAVIRTELESLDEHGRTAPATARLEQMRARLDDLSDPGARWNVVLDELVENLASEVRHRFQVAVRDLLRQADAELEAARSDGDWRAVTLRLQQQLADDAVVAFSAVESGIFDAQSRIVDLLADEGLELDRAVEIERGAFDALALLGILGRLLPATVASLLLSNPFVVAVDATNGLRQLPSEHDRHLAQQRQQARTAFRRIVDEALIEISTALLDALRTARQTVHDDLTGRLSDLLAAYANTARRYEEEAGQIMAARQARRLELAAVLETVAQLQAEQHHALQQLAPLLESLPTPAGAP